MTCIMLNSIYDHGYCTVRELKGCSPKSTVTRYDDCQSDRLYRRGRPLSMSRLDELRWEAQPWMWEAPSTDWGLRAQKKAKANPKPHCFLTEVKIQAAGLFLHVVHSTHMWAKYSHRQNKNSFKKKERETLLVATPAEHPDVKEKRKPSSAGSGFQIPTGPYTHKWHWRTVLTP